MTAPVDIPASKTLDQGFQLGTLRIDPKACEAAGPGGLERLDPKVMDVLVMLAQHAGDVVLREDLLARLWPNVVVTDEALSRCIYELRRQLSQAGGSPRYKEMIETLPKRGYRLTGEIAPIRPQPISGPAIHSRKLQVAAIIAVVVVILLAVFLGRRMASSPAAPPPSSVAAAANSIAVLPFADMSERQDQGYLSDGIAEEILNRLAQSESLRVIARTSSFSFRGEKLDASAIAGKLKVSHILEGSVRRSGDHVRVTAQLITASDNSHVWSQTYDRRLDDLFATQDEIAESVATALEVTLSASPSEAGMPASFEAYENYLQAEYFFNRRAIGDVERSVPYFKESVAIDPHYARAWAGLAGAYSYLAWSGTQVDKEFQRLQGEAARKAVELDPKLAVAHARLAQFYGETQDLAKSEEHDRIAQALGPNEPMVMGNASDAAFEAGDIRQAIAIQRRLVAQDPLNSLYLQNLGVLLIAAGHLDEAMAEYRRLLELRQDAGPDIEIEIPRILVLQGRDAEAHAAAMKLPEGWFRDQALALLYRVPAHRAEADAALTRLIERRYAEAQSIGDDIMFNIRLAEVQAFRGMSDDAFATLTQKKKILVKSWGKDAAIIWYHGHEAAVSPFLKPLHADPRWAEFKSEPQ